MNKKTLTLSSPQTHPIVFPSSHPPPHPVVLSSRPDLFAFRVADGIDQILRVFRRSGCQAGDDERGCEVQ